MVNVKSFARLSVALLVTYVFSLLTLSIPVFATHTYSEQYGTTTNLYGHFGQPHGYVISGDFTFIVTASKATEYVNFKIIKGEDYNNVLQQRNATSVTRGEKEDYYSLDWNSSGFENGDYKLFADVECDSCTEYGARDTVFHYDGKNHLEFTVENPVIQKPVIVEPKEDTCSEKLEEALELSDNIVTKHKDNLKFIDNFLAQTSNFYEKQNLESAEFVDQQASVNGFRETSSSSLVVLESLAEFSCESNLKEQVGNFVEQSRTTRDSLDSYKDGVINLIIILIGEL